MDTPYSADSAVLEELIDTGNLLDGAMLRLATVAPPGGPTEVLADFTEATFAGYAAEAITWSGPFFGPSGPPQVNSQLAVFEATAAASETIVAWYITNAAGTVLLASGNLDTPIVIDQAGAGLALSVAYRRYDGFAVVG